METPPPPKTQLLDAPLSAIGFNMEVLSPHRVKGSLVVTEKCVQVRTIT